MEKFDANIAAIHQQLFAGITESEITELDRLLKIIYNNLEKI